MDWGMQNRFARLFNPDSGHTVMFAVDHGYIMGPTSGLETFSQTVVPLLPHADVLMLTRGTLRHWIPPEIDLPIVLRVSGGTSVLNEELLREGIATSVEEAIRLNASGIAFSVMVGAKFERDTLLAFTQMVDEAERYGIPSLAVTAVGKELVRDVKYLSLATRLSAELGARLVKTYYCDGFEQVVQTSPVPVVIAGGKKLPTQEALELAYNAIQAGAVGVDMGRNIFQDEQPAAMIQAVGAIVHHKASVAEALELYQSLFRQALLPA
jgi:3-hydroxy-5-phosphonooxypentane-2,4-dione thiolase